MRVIGSAWRHVYIRCISSNGVEAGRRAAEISDFDHTVGDQQVGGLDVSVDEALGVQKRQSRHDI